MSAPRRILASLVVAGVLAALWGPAPRAQDRQKSVLSLYAGQKDSPMATDFDPTLERVLRERVPGGIDYYAEFMDLARFPEPSYLEAERTYLLSKFRGRKFDVVTATFGTAISFLKRNRDIFGDAPVVFASVADMAGLPNATGHIARLKFKDVIDTAITLQPDTERVVVVAGAAPWDKYYETVAREQFKAFEGRLAFTYLSGLHMPELLRQVAALPPHSIVFLSTVNEDGDGHKFQFFKTVDAVHAASNVPVYNWLDSSMSHGVVGGPMLSPPVLANRMAELVLRVLAGEKPDSIPVTEVDWSTSTSKFDWRQLQRWSISESRLPPGSAILHRPPSVWAEYGRYIIGGGVFLALQATFIVLLLLERSRRKHVEGNLRESEARFRVMADTAPVLLWRAGIDGLRDFFNRPWLEFTGRTLEQELGHGWSEGIHPDDLDDCLRRYSAGFGTRRSFRMEYRLRRNDGIYRWILGSVVPRYGPDGVFLGHIGSCIDVTDHRDTEEALRESQERYTLATAAGGVGVWDVNLETDEMFVDPEIKRILGFEGDDVPNLRSYWRMTVHPDDFGAVTTAAQAAISGVAAAFEIDHRAVAKDGSVRYCLQRGTVIRRPDGTPFRVVGTTTDITGRKEAEREKEYLTRHLQRLAGRLITAQEMERSRIARDLHDDVSQQLAGLSIALSGLKRRVGGLPGGPDLQAEVSSLQKRTSALADGVRYLSHDLHPGVLRHVGLVAALTSFTSDLQRHESKVALTFSATGNFDDTTIDASLCAYRVAQEAVRNALKHAHASHAEIRLIRSGDVIELTVADDGDGFDVELTRARGTGLGLISLTERVRLLGGKLGIVTELGKGTRVRIQIPANAPQPAAVVPDVNPALA